MTEHSFREVMYEVNRLCTEISNCDQDCPLKKMGCCGNLGTHCSDPLQTERIENIVMEWAAEHPEPVYPTWVEWFRQIGIVPSEQKCFHSWLLEQIPANIAQKLGIEPKEK